MPSKRPALLIQVEQRIFLIRSQKVMLSHDLAELYGVQAGALNRAVRRNPTRFPRDFMFQLSKKEWDRLEMPIWHFKFTWKGITKCDSRLGRQPTASLRLHRVLRSY